MSDDLRAAVAALELEPRSRVWTSVTYCVLDAVWSIGAHYDRVVNPLVRKVAAVHGNTSPTVVPEDAPADDPLPVGSFRAAYPTPESLIAVTNRQRTSSRGGIAKAEAALQYAAVLDSAGITTRAAAAAAHRDPALVESVSAGLRQIPGDGVRRDYFWMLVGSDELVKPDRMVLRFLARHGGPTQVEPARLALAELARELSTPQSPVTPWMLDHAIWRAERSSNSRRTRTRR